MHPLLYQTPQHPALLYPQVETPGALAEEPSEEEALPESNLETAGIRCNEDLQWPENTLDSKESVLDSNRSAGNISQLAKSPSCII